ncbi:Octanoyltransferase [Tetrabaena socialis]|uniref:lipoyl(octanoyl) transferase n=1 Tax=Tetrabaena socialis TaxID=47790 RepID=A0A2J8A958_9CHLO|nr:Octanoyltransferase [Tetrabaena socialis]|eukprot:PNH09013.1 Octanoyltransferase [Tetrabaena socialis]
MPLPQPRTNARPRHDLIAVAPPSHHTPFAPALQALQAAGAEVVVVPRGGEVTFHGPGQLVAYPVIDVRQAGLGARAYVEGLEDAVVEALGAYGLAARGRVPGATGVWVGQRKIAAVGVRISQGLSMRSQSCCETLAPMASRPGPPQAAPQPAGAATAVETGPPAATATPPAPGSLPPCELIMTSTLMAGKQKGRTVADYSADFQVEDSPASNGKGPHGKVERGRGAPGPGQPHWHAKQPKPTLSLSDCAGGDDAVAGGGPAGGGSATVTKPPSKDLDPHRVGQRQKQIDFGKNTLGYQRYLQQVPRRVVRLCVGGAELAEVAEPRVQCCRQQVPGDSARRQQRRKAVDPGTPDIGQNISKRAFDGQIKVWRRALHKYDTQAEEEDEEGPVARVVPFAQRRLQGCGDAPAAPEPSSPTNSNRSRGSLDGYVAPQADAGRKRPFQRAFDHVVEEGTRRSSTLMYESPDVRAGVVGGV